MLGRNQPRILQPAIVSQSAVGDHSYTLRNNANAENDVSEEDADSYELRSRGKERSRRSTSRDRLDDIVYITREIQEADTLNSIALQYCCTVADIKRVNNLINDQDFFALRCVKIPVKKFSVLAETHSSSVVTQVPHPSLVHCTPEFQKSQATSDLSNESVGNYLQEVDRDIEQIVKCTDSSRGSLSEVVSSFSTQQPYLEMDRKPVPRKDPYYGADWGMGWWTAVLIMLVVGIITPVFYLLYYEVLIKADVGHHSAVTLVNPAAHQDLHVKDSLHNTNIIAAKKQGNVPLDSLANAAHQHQT